ncbi:hypothetical protein [Sphingomonas sp. BK235]|uniref:hypothetical protein n=1 Tax=Sphingomonas sp. BK235 TaxID=2512131 RepID=UPI0010E1CCA0|nr:hypothetical protein [Sphingomonas sp. BK235]TCP34141.1 hypothetical protein EV292_104131 [Sphingomonas sp. BK235]
MKMPALATAAALLLAGCGGPAPGNEGSGAAADATAAPEVATTSVPAANVIAPEATAGVPDAAGAPNAAGAQRARGDYLGRWRGVEGLNLVVTPRAGSDAAVTLAMQWSLDDKGSYDGTVTADGIAFEREGTKELLRPSDGAATGLKYLDGKKDCLTVKAGEGYCRD